MAALNIQEFFKKYETLPPPNFLQGNSEETEFLTGFQGDLKEIADIEKRVMKLEQELVGVWADKITASMALLRAEMGAKQEEVLSKPEADVQNADEQKELRRVKKMVTEQAEVTKEIQKIQTENDRLYKDVTEKRKSCRDSHVRVRGLMLAVREEEEAMDQLTAELSGGAQAQRLKEDTAKLERKAEVKQFVLQRLVAASGVDWASDPHLLDIMTAQQ